MLEDKLKFNENDPIPQEEEKPKKEEKPVEVEEPLKEEEKVGPQPTLNEKINDAREEKKEEKKEEDKKEEKKEDKKEEEKKEEKGKEEGPKIENEAKPKEPEPKIPSDFTETISHLTKLKEEGNAKISSDLDAALAKYEEAYTLIEITMEKACTERDYNPQVSQLDTIRKQIFNNLALSYFKKNDFKKSNKIDIKLISIDPKFDKSYARLFKSYSNLEDNTRALYFGNLLKTKFTQETLDKYKDILPKIDEIAKIENDKLEAYRAEERKKVTKGILKYAVPLAVLVGAGLIYFFYFKKK